MIFFREFYKRIRSLGAISIENEKTKSLSQFFIEKYAEEKAKNPSLDAAELFEKTIRTLDLQNVRLNIIRKQPRQSEPGKSQEKAL